MNPIQKLVALAQKGDRRVLLGGAAAIGGGIGLIVYLSHRGAQSGQPSALPAPDQSQTLPAEGGGGGGGGSISDLFGGEGGSTPGDFLSSGGDLSLPLLPGSDTGSNLPISAPAESFPPLPALPDLSGLLAAPAIPALPALPPSYTGTDYGAVAPAPALASVAAGGGGGPAGAPRSIVSQLASELTARTREIAAEPYTSAAAAAAPAPARSTALPPVSAAPARSDVYVPGGGAVLPGVRETAAEYYARATAYVNALTQARAQASTPHTIAAEPYTPSPAVAPAAPARSTVSVSQPAPARSTGTVHEIAAEPLRSGLTVKPRSQLERLA
jgi:hypothetical protein